MLNSCTIIQSNGWFFKINKLNHAFHYYSPTSTGKQNMNVTLYAWMRPISVGEIYINLLDHTYVTSYTPAGTYTNITDVTNNYEHFWYCWGQLDPNKSRLVPKCPPTGISGDLGQIQCVCNANDVNAHGTIFRYLHDGVCHQLANQVLYFASPRITVEGVKGWKLSHFRFGAYGSNTSDWQNRISGCQGDSSVPSDDSDSYGQKINNVFANAPDSATAEELRDAELQVHVKHCLGKTPKKDDMAFLVEVREEARQQNEVLFAKVSMGLIDPNTYTEQANQIHDTMLDKIAARLSPEEFKQLFDFTPDNKVQLIDREAAEELLRTVIVFSGT